MRGTAPRDGAIVLGAGMSRRFHGRTWRWGVAVGVALATFPAAAGEIKLGENPISVILKWRPATPDPEVSDFVRDTRPPEKALDYKPLTEPKIERPKLKSKEELGAMVTGLDQTAAGLRQQGAAVGATNPADTMKQLQAAAAESRRRAVEDFKVGATPPAPAPAAAKQPKPARAAKPAT